MLFCYPSLRITYYGIGILLVVGSAVFTSYHPNLLFLDLIFAILFVVVLILVLTKIALKMYTKEVISLLQNCHVREYMDKLDKRMGKVRAPKMISSYVAFSALGYNMLGDYDAAFDCCQKITSDECKPDYYRFMIDYYLNKGLFDQADKTLCDFKAFAAGTKKKNVIKLCNKLMSDCENAIKFRKGMLDGLEEYYTQRLNSDQVSKVLISRVSFSHALGKLLILKGEPDRAKEYLQFARDNAGDTKFKALAEKLLSEI